MKGQTVQKVLFVIGIFLLTAGAPAFAHHPFDLEFDWKKPVTLTGTVTKVEWTSPHAVVFINAKDATGAITGWTIELGSPTVLEQRYGWNGNVLKTGETVTVNGWVAKNGEKLVSAKNFILTDGRDLFAASAFFDLPGRCISDEVCIEDESTAKSGSHSQR
jgi:hypothetical protein